jgi:hypothetical protein
VLGILKITVIKEDIKQVRKEEVSGVVAGSFKLMTSIYKESDTKEEWDKFMAEHDCMKNLTNEESPSCQKCGKELKAINPFFAKIHKKHFNKKQL